MKFASLNKLLVVYAILFACSVLLLGLNCLVAFVLWKEKHENGFYGQVPNKITSVFCEDVSMHPDDDHTLFQKADNRWKLMVDRQGRYICGSENATELVELTVEKQTRYRLSSDQRLTQYLSCGNRTLAEESGDLTIFFSQIADSNRNGSNDKDIVQWDKHNAHSYVNPVFSYQNGEITIPEKRIYFIYASVTFRFNRTLYGPHRQSLRICKKTFGYEQTLIGRSQLYYDTDRTAVTSLHIAGQVMLMKNDILLVRVSNLQVLETDAAGNTFGLFPT